jgi:hypothetical protein
VLAIATRRQYVNASILSSSGWRIVSRAVEAAMGCDDAFIVWCKKEQDFLCSEIERLESGRLRTYSLRGTVPTDTTASTILKLKTKLAELDMLLSKADELP